MIIVNCVWRREDIQKKIESIKIEGKHIFKLNKIVGIRMIFESKIDDLQGMKLMEKAIKEIPGQEALVINLVPMVNDNAFEGYRRTVCKTHGEAMKEAKNGIQI